MEHSLEEVKQQYINLHRELGEIRDNIHIKELEKIELNQEKDKITSKIREFNKHLVIIDSKIRGIEDSISNFYEKEEKIKQQEYKTLQKLNKKGIKDESSILSSIKPEKSIPQSFIKSFTETIKEDRSLTIKTYKEHSEGHSLFQPNKFESKLYSEHPSENFPAENSFEKEIEVDRKKRSKKFIQKQREETEIKNYLVNTADGNILKLSLSKSVSRKQKIGNISPKNFMIGKFNDFYVFYEIIKDRQISGAVVKFYDKRLDFYGESSIQAFDSEAHEFYKMGKVFYVCASGVLMSAVSREFKLIYLEGKNVRMRNFGWQIDGTVNDLVFKGNTLFCGSVKIIYKIENEREIDRLELKKEVLTICIDYTENLLVGTTHKIHRVSCKKMKVVQSVDIGYPTWFLADIGEGFLVGTHKKCQVVSDNHYVICDQKIGGFIEFSKIFIVWVGSRIDMFKKDTLRNVKTANFGAVVNKVISLD